MPIQSCRQHTYGITGSADTIVVIRRKRNEAFGTIHVTGRDVADEEIPARFDELAWTAAPAALAEGTFERSEIYRVIEERGPIFPKAIGDLLGLERTSVAHMVNTLVAKGAVVRAKGGYEVARVTFEDEIALSPRVHHHHSKSEVSEGGHPPAGAPAREETPVLRVVPADPTGWANPCLWYRDHQTRHRQTPSGWTCDACYPEEDPA